MTDQMGVVDRSARSSQPKHADRLAVPCLLLTTGNFNSGFSFPATESSIPRMRTGLAELWSFTRPARHSQGHSFARSRASRGGWVQSARSSVWTRVGWMVCLSGPPRLRRQPMTCQHSASRAESRWMLSRWSARAQAPASSSSSIPSGARPLTRRNPSCLPLCPCQGFLLILLLVRPVLLWVLLIQLLVGLDLAFN